MGEAQIIGAAAELEESNGDSPSPKALKARARRMFGNKAWIEVTSADDLLFALTTGRGLDGEVVDGAGVFEAMSVPKLREEARIKFGPAVWIASARRDTLLEALRTGKEPEGVPAGRRVRVEGPDSAALESAIRAVLAAMPAPATPENLPVPATPAGLDEAATRRVVQDALGRHLEPVLGELKDVKDAESLIATKLREVVLEVGGINRRIEDGRGRVDEMVKTRLDDAVKALHGHVNQVRDEFANMTDARLEEKIENIGESIRVSLQKRLVKEVVVKKLDVKVPMGAQHAQFGELLQIVSCGVHPFLVGPAGSGKTKAAEEVAKALEKPFYPQSFNSQTPSSQLFGYMDAHGNYVDTVFRRAFEGGGVWLADEIDRANGNVMTGLNAALGNGYCSFPDKVVPRHQDFVCIASANTWGRGADRLYVGANQLDEATLNRFVQMEWEYDEDLERLLAQNDSWVERVQAIRKGVFQERVRHIVSPRASFDGARLLAGGMKRNRVEEIAVWKGLDEATRKKVLAVVPKQGLTVKVEV